MGAVTYPNERVAKFINDNFVPVQVNVVDHPEFTDRFHERWTPCIIFIDSNEVEHRRQRGYTYPEDFLADLMMALAQTEFDNKSFEKAIEYYHHVAEEHSDTLAAPEALYMEGVARYRATGDGNYLEQYWDEVMERYPGTRWAKAGDID